MNFSFLVAVAAAVLPVHSAWAQAGGIYTCVDAKGRKLTSDRPIPECNDRDQKVLNPSGTVRGQVGPSLTATERQALEAKERQRREEQARRDEDKRRERALLIRYPHQAEHDKERAEAINQIGVVKAAAVHRLTALTEQRKKLDQEMEFYKKDPSKAPPNLRRELDDVNQNIRVQERFIKEQDAEVQRVNTRFDEELVRLRDLWNLRTGGSAAAAASAPRR
ncbi:MAG: hypothetical protein RLZZ126_283 [Pseudomonadota bacterium]